LATAGKCCYIGPIGDSERQMDAAISLQQSPIGYLAVHKFRVGNHDIDLDHSVVAVVKAGRCRWKIETENNNTLKTKGYPFEHNDGHGQQQLSSRLASLIILAFLVHTALEWMDDQYPLLRQQLPSRQR